MIPGSGAGGGHLSLSSVGTTRRKVRAPGDPQTEGDQSSPQLQASVSNTSQYPRDATVAFYAGDTKLATTSTTISAYGNETMAEKVDWSTWEAKGLAGDSHDLRAKLENTGATMTSGSIHVYEEPTTSDPPDEPNEPNDPRDGDDGESSDPTGPAPILPEGFPTLPAIGPLTAEQTTAGAAVALVLVVLLR